MVLVPNFITIPLVGAVMGYVSCDNPYAQVFSRSKGAVGIVNSGGVCDSTMSTLVRVGIGALAGLAFYVATND